VELLSFDHCPQVQYQACWALTNIVAHQSAIPFLSLGTIYILLSLFTVVAGLVEKCTKLIETHSNVFNDTKGETEHSRQVQEQSIWCLGNIAGDSIQARDYVLRNGGMKTILKLLENPHTMSIERVATWFISNMCKGQPPPNPASVAPGLYCKIVLEIR
jgi:hypothetical protein